MWNGMKSLMELKRVQCNEVEWNAMKWKGQPTLAQLHCLYI